MAEAIPPAGATPPGERSAALSEGITKTFSDFLFYGDFPAQPEPDEVGRTMLEEGPAMDAIWAAVREGRLPRVIPGERRRGSGVDFFLLHGEMPDLERDGPSASCATGWRGGRHIPLNCRIPGPSSPAGDIPPLPAGSRFAPST